MFLIISSQMRCKVLVLGRVLERGATDEDCRWLICRVTRWLETSLVVHCLSLFALNAGATGSILAQGTRSYMPWVSDSCSVVSDSLQPTRLLCPWNSPGKNTGVSCHFLLQRIFPTQGWMWPNPHCRWMLLPSELLGNPMVLSKHSESRQRLLKIFILSEKARHNHTVFKGTYLKCKQKDK